MNKSMKFKRRAMTPLSSRNLVSTTRMRKSERSQPKTRSKYSKLSPSPLKSKSSRTIDPLKQEVLDLKRQEKALKGKLDLMEMESKHMADKFKQTQIDLQKRRSKLNKDKAQIIDLFTNFVMQKNVVLKLDTLTKSKSKRGLGFKKQKTPEIVRNSEFSTVGNSNSNQTTRDNDKGELKGLYSGLSNKQHLVTSSNLRLLIREIDEN